MAGARGMTIEEVVKQALVAARQATSTTARAPNFADGAGEGEGAPARVAGATGGRRHGAHPPGPRRGPASWTPP